ncbi:hypothetical protein FALBO_9426 [Fusarium albosuccineum]|uniref:DUF7703 domain-containing protein n=1 Tax=Fusarium albosuccineum TaxID=1237068 RepID=A0A8H4PBZ6_9HYPO|nr:hypothetical protein FALBO_9426 [Fusarium albosuccineum]
MPFSAPASDCLLQQHLPGTWATPSQRHQTSYSRVGSYGTVAVALLLPKALPGDVAAHDTHLTTLKVGKGMSVPHSNADPGKTADGRYTPEAVMTCATVSLYNSLELLSLIFTTFRSRKGLYFWSLLVASFVVIPYAVGWLTDYFDLAGDVAGILIGDIGWMLLITGQALVLYSRLHLVLRNENILRAIKWMIIFNAVVWHTTMTVLLFTISYRPKEGRGSYNHIFNTMEKVHMTCFCVQEFVLSGLYLWKALDILKTALGSTRRIMWQLFSTNVLIVAMDIALLAVEFSGYYLWQQGLKVVMYSIKLKFEFAVLGKLIELVQHRGDSNPGPNSTPIFDFVKIPPDRPGKTNKKAHSIAAPEAITIEHVRTRSTISSSLSPSSNRATVPGHIMVRRSVNVEGVVLEEGGNKSTDELFEDPSRASKH